MFGGGSGKRNSGDLRRGGDGPPRPSRGTGMSFAVKKQVSIESGVSTASAADRAQQARINFDEDALRAKMTPQERYRRDIGQRLEEIIMRAPEADFDLEQRFSFDQDPTATTTSLAGADRGAVRSRLTLRDTWQCDIEDERFEGIIDALHELLLDAIRGDDLLEELSAEWSEAGNLAAALGILGRPGEDLTAMGH